MSATTWPPTSAGAHTPWPLRRHAPDVAAALDISYRHAAAVVARATSGPARKPTPQEGR
ncbi:hypothetical protein [Nonomuraea diastatica]|uniref:hypothetical protein n=1 Tax=Nonomuraea diastatica TaxID=1848329 RepID=UPI00140A5B4D|nr:hypothetical protein [Nonomuraea diastatica]